MPASPGSTTAEADSELVDFVVARMLDHLGSSNDWFSRAGQAER